ncbi:MAG: type II toxin-antitoxin system VapC family toxin [Desulfamplus sp.]|nr:type II toxin-antitoxin system VapC family toxin [Desulfamplus sp.]
MNIVVDTSAIIAVIANEPNKPNIIKVTRGADLLAPKSVHWEIGNAFSAMLKRHRITLDDARKAIAVYHQIQIQLVDVELVETLVIANNLNIYAYDAYLIRCSQKYDAPLLSLDGGLLRTAKPYNIKVIEVTE